jgi:hypothetical protein
MDAIAIKNNGRVVEWIGGGLQILPRRFESGPAFKIYCMPVTRKLHNKKLTQKDITNLIKERSRLLDKDYNDSKADLIQQHITASFKKYFKGYPCDFIIETLTEFGQAPNIIYDDNGLFAMSADGYQPVVTGDEKLEGELMVFVMKKDMWKPTIREALWHYLQS